MVILFSHWTSGDEVEFINGMATVEDIIAAVPVEFQGVVDLCVCHPAKLATALQRERPRCFVKSSPDRAIHFTFWLHFYEVLVEVLLHKQVDYCQAIEQTILLFDCTRLGS